MNIDRYIKSAIDQYLLATESTAKQLSEKVGVSTVAVSKWRRMTSGINQVVWLKLFPIIREYLPDDRLFIDSTGQTQYRSATGETPREDTAKAVFVPLFTLEQLGLFNKLESVTSFAASCDITQKADYYPKHSSKRDILAICVPDGMGYIPPRTTLFADALEYPVNGKLAVFRRVGSDVAELGVFKTDHKVFSILPVTGEPITGESKLMHLQIFWIFPILYYEVICL